MTLTQLFDIEYIAFTIYGYPFSYVELIGSAFGLIAVWLATRQNILTWSIGLANIICFFAIFYQVHLYADMLLQIFYFATNLYGWATWNEQQKAQKPLSYLSKKERYTYLGAIILFSLLIGYCVQNLHQWMPSVFIHPAAFPYADSLVAVASIVATWLLARRIIENWVIWIVVNALCVYIYSQKLIMMIALEYVFFFFLACYGLYNWAKSKQEHRTKNYDLYIEP